MTKQISFEDIRKGDRIRVQYKDRYGVTGTGEGVAHSSSYGGWFTSENGLIAAAADEATITLLHRPEPQESEGVGAVIETETGIRLVSIHPRPGGRRWVRLWATGRGTSDFTSAWAWDALVRAYGSISVVREGV